MVMLEEPVYLECFMRRVPLKPIKPNHKTQLLFVLFFFTLIASQILLILPSKSKNSISIQSNSDGYPWRNSC